MNLSNYDATFFHGYRSPCCRSPIHTQLNAQYDELSAVCNSCGERVVTINTWRMPVVENYKALLRLLVHTQMNPLYVASDDEIELLYKSDD